MKKRRLGGLIFIDFHIYINYNIIMQSVFARAKVNLALNVVGRDGPKHLLDGIYACCDLGDTVTVSARKDKEIRVSYEGREGVFERDTSVLTARLLQESYMTTGADIMICKRIPEKRGLGGSSADAAGVARAFEAEFGLGKIDASVLLSVGSDVPFQYVGGCARVSGKGEKISPQKLPRLYLALLLPPKGVSTAECFALYDRVGGETGDIDALTETLKRKEPPVFKNALERAATILAPEIGVGRKILEDAGFACGMTGSGSALFGAEYDESIFREKLKRVILPRGFTLTETMTEAEL